MTWRISPSRPSTGSIDPAFARAVRSIVNWSSAPPATGPAPAAWACAAAPPATPGATASELEAVILASSCRNASAGIAPRRALASRATKERESSPSSAASKWPERISATLLVKDASSQASRASCTT